MISTIPQIKFQVTFILLFADVLDLQTKKNPALSKFASNLFLERKKTLWEVDKMLTGHQHFLPFPQCFQKLSLSRSLNSGLCGKGLTLHHTILTYNDPKKETFLTHCGKWRKCW